MGREQDHVINALIDATRAPGCTPKLQALGMSADAAAQIIAHTATIPAFQRGLNARLDQHYAAPLRPLGTDKLVFVHIPKCGGTTLHDMLVQWYGADQTHPERHNGLYFYSSRDLASKSLFSGHYDFYSSQLVPGRPRLVTFLRDPRSRLVSLYHFHRSHRDDLIAQFNLTLAKWANMYDINEYFANPEVRAHPAIHNSITRHLSNQPQLGRLSGNIAESPDSIEVLCDQAKANVRRFDFIGLMEDYDQSIADLCVLLNRPSPDTIGRARNFETLIETDPNMKPIEKQVPTEETHRLMDDLVAQDETVYAFAKALKPDPATAG